MKQYKAFVLAILCCFLLVACDNSGAPKIGVVDVNRLMKDSEPGKEALKFIEAKQASLQDELDKIQDRLEKNPTDEASMKELQRVYATSQQQIQTEGQGIVGALFDSIQGVMDKFRSRQGYALLIRVEALDSFDPALDVTTALMADVNKLKLDFTALARAFGKSGQNAGQQDAATPASQKEGAEAEGGAPASQDKGK